MGKQITPQEHKNQIKRYSIERAKYVIYARALKRVFEQACDACIPERIVQTRAKTVSSFAEKCVRKFDKYPDAVNQLTDLCGARIIVQTTEQVNAVKLFIERNFKIEERDDKGLLLELNKFGYRDMHYLIRLRADVAPLIGFTKRECDLIGQRVAEIQVRSIVQHAWADILHDRMYKTPLKLTSEMNRTGALLAAIMEDGDRSFDRLAVELDGMVANYTAYAASDQVRDEIAALELILKNEAKNKVQVALDLARRLGPCGNYERLIEVLAPFVNNHKSRPEVLLEYGHGLCRVHRLSPQSAQYQRGQRLLEEVVEGCEQNNWASVPNLRKQKSFLAKALSRLAWTWEPSVLRSSGQALAGYRHALETEPANPYHLANQLSFEIFCNVPSARSIVESMRTNIEQAIKVCREHALAGTELPYALFTAGRLRLLLRQGGPALGWYARGLRHLFYGDSCVQVDILEDELRWIGRLHFGSEQPPQEHRWIERLIILGQSFRPEKKIARARSSRNQTKPARTLIIAGGAGTMTLSMLKKARPLLARALENFQGTVISGGTKSGIPGCVGELAKELKKKRQKRFELVGYVPEFLPQDAPKDSNYDRHEQITGERSFSPEQVLRMWEDFCKARISPRQVLLLGIGGGPVSAVEFRVAFALGASVAIVQDSGGEADLLLADPVWSGEPALMALPFDEASVQSFVTIPSLGQDADTIGEMAQEFHAQYVKNRADSLSENVRPWAKLPPTYRTANIEQARYAVEILRSMGFALRRRKVPVIFDKFTKKEIKRMAELEHGRWNVERLRNGWRPGAIRDDAKKIHNCLVPWNKLPAKIKSYDYAAVKAFPQILAKANLEIYRR
jgi:ppGpp synthetase/RelA/SpoT-type nucleotidyltranferase